jgi:hypothetical protein
MNVLRFSMQGNVAEAVSVRSLQDRARAAGVRRTRFTYTFTGLHRSERREFLCHITCSGQIAAFLVKQLRVTEAAAQQRGDLKIADACRRASGEMLALLMSPANPQHSMRASDYVKSERQKTSAYSDSAGAFAGFRIPGATRTSFAP